MRELKNEIQHAAIVCSSGMIDEIHLPRFAEQSAGLNDTLSRNTIVLESGDR